MSKNILVLCGSSRKSGNTEMLADAFIRGAERNGHKVKKITLFHANVHECMDCKYCYTHDGCCVFKDDMQSIYEAMEQADILVVASPVYFYSFPATLKAVFDRLHNPIRNTFKIRETYLLTAYADQGEAVCKPMVETYKAIISYLNWQDKGIVAVDGVEDKGSMKGNKALVQAEKMGMQI